MKQNNKDTFLENLSESVADLKYQRKVLFLSFENRIFNTLVALVVISILRKGVGLFLPFETILVFIAWFLVSAAYLVFFRGKLCKNFTILNNVHFSYYLFGITFATMLVHYLGGIEWAGFFIYIIDIVYSSALLTRVRGTMVAVMASVSFFLLSYFEYTGAIVHRSFLTLVAPMYDQTVFFAGVTIIIVSFFMLLSFVTGFFSRLKDEREKDIMDSRRRFKTKSIQLERLAMKLKKKVSENLYIKRAALGYVEKKEFELRAVRKDLEEQIDKQRRTQKSMLFMIEDLNEMSTQLKDARDHLEEKVRERTDELMKISKKLHRGERLAFLGKLAGSITHELRDPLAVIRNSIDYLDIQFKRVGSDEKIEKYIEILKRQVVIINSIVDDIIGFAKTQPPKLEESDLNDVLNNILVMINVPKLVKVKKEWGVLPNIHLDKNQLRHTVTNIVNNAIVAMNGNGNLYLRTLIKGENVCIEIEDTGPGIPDEEKELIFEPLYSSKPKGVGLGLPIAKMMTENQGGTLDFDTKVGKGTTFKIYLPLAR